MAWVAVMAGTAIAGSVVSGVGSIISGNARADADKAAAAGDLFAGQAAKDGAYFKAAALEQGGVFAKREADFTAEQLDMEANNARAAGQRQAMEKRRDATLALSTLIARAASSGGGATDPTIRNIAYNVAERGEYQALAEMFTGETTRIGLKNQAAAVRYTGAAKKYASQVEAVASRYGGDTGLAAGTMRANAANNAAGSDMLAGLASGTGTILGGIGSAYKTYGRPPYGTGTGGLY